jgi:hypothetical protein
MGLPRIRRIDFILTQSKEGLQVALVLCAAEAPARARIDRTIRSMKPSHSEGPRLCSVMPSVGANMSFPGKHGVMRQARRTSEDTCQGHKVAEEASDYPWLQAYDNQRAFCQTD